MKTGTKIIATNSPYNPNLPNGSIMTVTMFRDDGDVEATVDNGDGFNWFMDAGSFKEYTHGHVTLPDGRTVDLTANRVRCDLMDPDELRALKGHGGPYEIWGVKGWILMGSTPAWDHHNTYRVAPKPVVETVVLCYRRDSGMVKNRIGTINLIDGKPDMASIIDTKTEEL